MKFLRPPPVVMLILSSAGCGGSVSTPQEPTPPPNRAPTASIGSPANGIDVSEGQSIEFTGSATDPEDGTLAGASLVWTSSIDGPIGTGTQFTRSDLAVGNHTITLTATDSDGAQGSASVATAIQPVPQTGWATMGTAFPDDARQVAVGADGSALFLFLGWTDAALPTLEQARIEGWTGDAWAATTFRTNDGDRSFEAAAEGSSGAVTWNDESLRLGRAERTEGGDWSGLVISSLSQRNSPTIAFALGEPFYGFVEQGRMHVFTPLLSTLPEVSGGLGQLSTSNDCALVNDCIRSISLAGDADAWYAAVSEPDGCISVMRGSLVAGTPQTEWLGPCFALGGGAAEPRAALLDARPVVAFLEDGGTTFLMAQWDGVNWVLFGQATIDLATEVDIVSDGAILYVLFLTPDGPAPRMVVQRFDGEWSVLPEQIEGEGSELSPVADIAVFEAQPLVAFIEDGRAVVKRFVPGMSPVPPFRAEAGQMITRPGVRATLAGPR